MMELYEEKVERNRQRLWEEDAQLEINILQEKLSRALENNKKLCEERNELCQKSMSPSLPKEWNPKTNDTYCEVPH
jgi:hypothetical protein